MENCSKENATSALIFIFIYIIFNIFWGINYNRKGIAYQLQLTELKV